MYYRRFCICNFLDQAHTHEAVAFDNEAITREHLPLRCPRRVQNKTKLLPHESDLLARGELANVAHEIASSSWLLATSTDEASLETGRILRYRRYMGDVEFTDLLQ
jgi:hypothetical protein